MDATAVPKTLAVLGAPKAAKSVTTLRGGELVSVGADVVEDLRAGNRAYRARMLFQSGHVDTYR